MAFNIVVVNFFFISASDIIMDTVLSPDPTLCEGKGLVPVIVESFPEGGSCKLSSLVFGYANQIAAL